MVKGDKLPSMASTLEDSGELWRLENGLFDVVSDVQRRRTQGGLFLGSYAALSGRMELGMASNGAWISLRSEPARSS